MSTITQCTTKQIEKFLRKVNKRGPDDCWEWLGFRGPSGHGRVGLNGVNYYAHRIAYELEYGPIPPGLAVRHKCDFAPCCNPAHLELGTRADNNRDRTISDRPHNAPPAAYTKPTIEERFYAMVSKTPTATGCIEWLGCFSHGYGRFGIEGGKKTVLAHRYAWELVHGPIPAGMKCLHKCDNPRCVNVESHIWLGTQSENVDDMHEKGRANHPPSPGERNGFSKLTDAQVKEIRSPKYETWSLIDIAAQFGVTNSCVCSILKRQSWAHLDSDGDAPIRDRQARGERQGNAKFTEAQILEMRSEKYAGWTQRAIAESFGTSQKAVSSILRRERWMHLDSSGDAPIAQERARVFLPRSEQNRKTKVTEAQVLEIRSGKFAGWSQSAIAALFGIKRGAVSKILRRERWTHLDSSGDAPIASGRGRNTRGEKNGLAKLTAAAVIEIRNEENASKTLQELAEHFGVDVTTISCIRLRKTWKHI